MRSRFLTALSGPAPSIGWPRPPGAVSEFLFNARCTKCDKCIDACPFGAIGPLPDGPSAGTPAMNPNVAACHLCEDMPCITACKDDALRMVEPHQVILGIAMVQQDKCFAFMGPECGACVPVCPISAITKDRERPVIDAEICNGCGLCREACPVWGKAINVVL